MAIEQRNEDVLTAREHKRLIAADKVMGAPGSITSVTFTAVETRFAS